MAEVVVRVDGSQMVVECVDNWDPGGPWHSGPYRAECSCGWKGHGKVEPLLAIMKHHHRERHAPVSLVSVDDDG